MVAVAARTLLGTTLATIRRAGSHVFAMVRVPFHPLVGWLRARIGDLCYKKLFVGGFLSTDDRGVCAQREVDVGIGPEVGLEFWAPSTLRAAVMEDTI